MKIEMSREDIQVAIAFWLQAKFPQYDCRLEKTYNISGEVDVEMSERVVTPNETKAESAV